MKQGAVDVVSGDEPLSQAYLPDIAPLFEECLSAGQPRIVLDLEKVALIDSSGLELMLDVADRCAERGGALRLAGPNVLCQDILYATGVSAQFDIFGHVGEAAGSFAV